MVSRYLGGPFSPEAVRKRLGQEIECLRIHGHQYWPIFLLSTEEHVGCAGLRPYKPEDAICELGFHLLPRFWGKGLACEAGRAVIKFAFEAIGTQALFAGHHPENHASRRVLMKLGFHLTHKEFYPATGLMHPSYLLSLSNWQVLSGRGDPPTCSKG